MTSYRTQGLLAIGTGALALAACSTPDLATNLRPDGPPEVLTVMVLTDQPSPFGGAVTESATFCKGATTGATGTNIDPKDPTVVGLPDFSILQLCPDPDAKGDANANPPLMPGQDVAGGPASLPVAEVTNADPMNWLARVEFDELLNPDVETLTNSDGTGACGEMDDGCVGHINTTLPFTLTCKDKTGADFDVPYDGYYVPNGNNVSWPVGPNVTVFPIDRSTIPAGSECSLSVKADVIKDKDGNAVPTDELGPYTFKTTGLAITGSDPPSCADVTDPTCPEGVTAGSCDGGANAGAGCAADTDCPGSVCDPFTPTITFNAPIDPASVTVPTDVTVTDSAGNPVAISTSTDGANTLIITPNTIWAADTYTVTIPANATFADLAGGTLTVPSDINMLFTVQ